MNTLNEVKKSSVLPLLAALLTLSACSSSSQIERLHHFPWENSVGYAQVVKTPDTIYISGVTSSKTSYEEQLHDIYQVIAQLLAAYNLNTDAIVKETIYTTDIDKLKSAIALRKKYYANGSYPSSTWVQVSRLFDPANEIEIEVIASAK